MLYSYFLHFLIYNLADEIGFVDSASKLMGYVDISGKLCNIAAADDPKIKFFMTTSTALND